MYTKCTKKHLRIGVAVLIVFCISSPAQGSSQSISSYLDMLDFINKNKLQFYWDATYYVGMITSGSTVVNFMPGVKTVLVNFTSLYNADPVIETRDGLKISRAFADFLKDTFSQTRLRNESKDKVNKEKKTTADAEFNAISVVVIDPGHGGRDPGAVGSFSYNGKSYKILEKTVVLKVALKIRKLLQKEFPRLKIIMTRDTDTFISLEKRTVIANRHLENIKPDEAILFISIHGNGFSNQESNGYEVWYAPPEHRRELVDKNAVGNKNIYSILNSIREEELILENVQLAKMVISGMASTIGSKSRNRGIKKALWYVVRNSKMPAVLIELGFITNPKEGVLLSTNAYQDTLSRGIVQGIKDYIELFDVSQIK